MEATLSRSALASAPMVMRPFRSRIAIPSCSRCWISRLMSDGHFEADHGFHFFDGNHLDGVPRAAVQESAIRPLAGALLAADAQHGIYFDVAEGRMLVVGHPVHAVGHRAIGHAGRRTRAAGAAFGDDGEFLGPLLARGGDTLRLGLHLDDSNGGHAWIIARFSRQMRRGLSSVRGPGYCDWRAARPFSIHAAFVAGGRRGGWRRAAE